MIDYCSFNPVKCMYLSTNHQSSNCKITSHTINYYPGYLTPENIANIAHNLTSHHCPEALDNFAEQLGFSREKIHEKQLLKSMEDLLYQIIFSWTSKSPANTVKTLAKILHSCGLFQEAIRLDPVCKWRNCGILFWLIDDLLSQ